MLNEEFALEANSTAVTAAAALTPRRGVMQYSPSYRYNESARPPVFRVLPVRFMFGILFNESNTPI